MRERGAGSGAGAAGRTDTKIESRIKQGARAAAEGRGKSVLPEGRRLAHSSNEQGWNRFVALSLHAVPQSLGSRPYPAVSSRLARKLNFQRFEKPGQPQLERKTSRTHRAGRKQAAAAPLPLCMHRRFAAQGSRPPYGELQGLSCGRLLIKAFSHLRRFGLLLHWHLLLLLLSFGIASWSEWDVGCARLGNL